MTRFFPKLYLDFSSFWAGIILVVLLVVLYIIYRKRLKTFLSRITSKIIHFRESLSVTSDSDYIQVLYKYMQGLHICSGHFPLDKILVPSRCIAPPPYLFPVKRSLDTSLIQKSIGYDPLLPELNSEFFGPSFPLIDALITGTNICLVGYPGTGKTTAIAECIENLIYVRDDEDQTETKIPFYLRAHDLLAQFPGRDMLAMLLRALQLNNIYRVIPNFPRFLTTSIKSGHAVLFIDDMDHLTLDDINRLANFITALHGQIPGIQIITTASPSCLGNLVTAPVEFLSISPWNNKDKYAFLEKLSKLWPSIQSAEVPELSAGYSVMNAMLVVSGKNLTPLEFTLRSLAAYGGDLPGPHSTHAIDAYLKRDPSLTSDYINTLELIAAFCLHSGNSSFIRRDLSSWFENTYKRGSVQPEPQKFAPFQSVIQTSLDLGFLCHGPDNSYYFTYPTIAGFLGSRGISHLNHQTKHVILESPDWGILHESMRYFSAYNDIKPVVKPFLADKSLLRNKLLRAAQWLPFLEINSPEETALMKQITREIHSNSIYLIKVRLACSLTKSSNPQVKSIFQHFAKSKDLDTRRAAAVGLGLLQDLSAVPLLINQLNDSHPSSTAACYALGKIGSPRSLEAIAEALLHGGELLRRAAAESLAQNRSEGHPALREGSTMEDLLVRYAVVHGLSQINETWSLEILDTMRIDEKEWVVRDLAQQTYDILKTRSPYTPQSSPNPHEAPWLQEFAVEQDLAVPSPENGLELLLKALELGTDEQKQNALAHIAHTGKEELIPFLLEMISSESFNISHQAFLTIWYSAPQRYKLHS